MSCGGKPSSFTYKVAFDPSWYSLTAPGRESNITAFTTELIEAIAKSEKVSITVYQRSWNNLVYGLGAGDYNAICTTMEPHLFYEKIYDFSDLYLMTGPVLVTSTKNPFTDLTQLSGKEVATLRGSKTALILEKYPAIIQRTYDSVQTAFIDTEQGTIEGALVDILTAQAFTQDLFHGQLTISTPPLTEAGVRLLSIKGDRFIQIYNKGLSRLKASGTYATLAKKWRLSEQAPSL